MTATGQARMLAALAGSQFPLGAPPTMAARTSPSHPSDPITLCLFDDTGTQNPDTAGPMTADEGRLLALWKSRTPGFSCQTVGTLRRPSAHTRLTGPVCAVSTCAPIVGV